MGDTPAPRDPAPSNRWKVRGAIVVGLGAAFGLGWALAPTRGSDVHGVTHAPTGANPLPRSGVHLQLDAGGLTLVPDGGLTLAPLPSLDPGALYDETLQPSARPAPGQRDHRAPEPHPE